MYRYVMTLVLTFIVFGILSVIVIFNVHAEIDIEKLIMAESSGNPKAISSDSCYGLMQIGQPCLTDYNKANNTNYTLKDMLSGEVNRVVGEWYLGWLKNFVISHLSTNTDRDILIAYNWGCGSWLKWKRNGELWSKLPTETKNYIRRILWQA